MWVELFSLLITSIAFHQPTHLSAIFGFSHDCGLIISEARFYGWGRKIDFLRSKGKKTSPKKRSRREKQNNRKFIQGILNKHLWGKLFARKADWDWFRSCFDTCRIDRFVCASNWNVCVFDIVCRFLSKLDLLSRSQKNLHLKMLFSCFLFASSYSL